MPQLAVLLSFAKNAWRNLRCLPSWLVAVVCGCFSTIGLTYSTVLAQSVPAVSPRRVVPNRNGTSAESSPLKGSPEPDDGDHRPLAASYSRYSCEHQNDTSIEDQRRLSRERANAEGYRLPTELEYADAAISGTKLKRDGLEQLLKDAACKRFDVLIFHSLSRLARESVIGMPILKKLVFEHGVRFISVSESIDSQNATWVMIATLYLLQHENFINELSKNVHRGQVGAVLSGFAVGDHRFGYRSIPSPGGEMIGHGRNAKPRMIYQIDLEQAEWVKQIFAWFVGERRTISWITRELNSRNAPKDHRSTTARWHHSLVIGVLTSSKYIGQWSWGVKSNRRIPSTGQLTQVSRPESETRPWDREFPELRIITDEVFSAAQEIRKKNVERGARTRDAQGRLVGRFADRNYQHLLAGLLKCKLCGNTFHTAGTSAKYMSCSGHKSGICTCRTTVPRQFAQKLILERVSKAIKSNSNWIRQIVSITTNAIEEAEKDEPNRRVQLEQELKIVEQRINRLIDQAESTDDIGIADRLLQRRKEKDDLLRRIRELDLNKSTIPQVCVAEWVEHQIEHLDEVLKSGTPAATESLQKLLAGPIEMEEVPHVDRERCHLRGKFKIRVGRLTIDRSSEIPGITAEITADGDLLEEITIDFRERTKTEEQAETAWRLLNEQRPIKEIAELLHVSRSRMTAILKFAAAERGEEQIDGRRRRSTLPDSTRPPTIGDLKTDEVMRLYHENVLLSEIAVRLTIDRNTVTDVIAKWHQKQGLSVLDGRTRRKSLDLKSSIRKPA